MFEGSWPKEYWLLWHIFIHFTSFKMSLSHKVLAYAASSQSVGVFWTRSWSQSISCTINILYISFDCLFLFHSSEQNIFLQSLNNTWIIHLISQWLRKTWMYIPQHNRKLNLVTYYLNVMTLFLWELALTPTQTKAEETHFDCNGYKYNEIRLTESCSLPAAQRYSIQNLLPCLEGEGANIGPGGHLPAYPKHTLILLCQTDFCNEKHCTKHDATSLDKVVSLPNKIC